MTILSCFLATKASRMAASNLSPFPMLQTLQFSLTARPIMCLLVLTGATLIKALLKRQHNLGACPPAVRNSTHGFSRVTGFKTHSQKNTISEASKTSFPKFVKPEEVANSESQRRASSKAGFLLTNAVLLQRIIPPPGSTSGAWNRSRK